MKNKSVYKMTCTAMCLALAFVLPFFTGQIKTIGNMLSPMHIPVFLCGFVCGWPWGILVGVIAPLLRSLIFGMPAFFPSAVAMAFELAGYGFFAGLLYKLLPKKPIYIYLSLILAMICGRVIWGIVRFLIAGFQHTEFSFQAFIAGGVTNAIPGMILQVVLIPLIIMALERSNLIVNGDRCLQNGK